MADPAIGSDLAAAGRLRPLGAAIGRTKLLLALFLWLSGLLLLFVDIGALAPLREIAFVLFLALAVPVAKPMTRLLAAIGGAAALLLAVAYDDPAAVLAAADRAMVFALFLPALFLLRETMQASPESAEARAAFEALGPGRRIAGLTVGSHLVASVMIIGALPIIQPFIVRQGDDVLRLELVRAAMRGFALSVLWSPFTVAMVFVTTQKPDVTLLQIIGVGLPLAAAALVAAVFVDRRWAGVRAALPALAAFRSLGPAIALLVGVVVAVASVAPFSTLEVVALVLPPLCLARLVSLGGTAPRRAVRDAVVTLPRMGDELLLFTAALLLGALITASGAPGLIVEVLHLDAWPTALVPALLLALGPVLALAGLHPIVAGTLLFALMQPLDGRLPDLMQVQIVLFGWMAGAMVSYASLSVVAASGFFQVPLRALVVSVNVAFLFGLAIALAAMQGALLALTS